MAHTKVTKTYSQNTGTANTFSYSGSFDVFKGTEVVALLDGVALTYTATTINESASPREYSVDTAAKTIHIGGADLSSGSIVMRPATDMGSPTPRATYTPGASITSADLNNNQLQLMRKAMEYDETKLSSTGGTMTGHLTMGEDQTIIFEGATDDAHETTLTVTDPTADRTITLPNVTGTVVTTGDTATVTATMMAADSVDSSELVDGSIDANHIATGAVTTAKLGADAVDSSKLADNAVDSEHYVDGSIDTAHIADLQVTTAKIAADAITGAKIADDALDSEHYAADSIDAEHYAPGSVDATALASNAVTTAKINADAVTGAKIADDSIDSEHYVDASIDAAHIASNAVTTAKINADAVTGAKIADDSIDSEHYADGSIDTAHIADANVTLAKIENVTDGRIIVGNGSNRPAEVAVSGDVTIANTGAVTIANDAVEIGMIGCEQTTISDSDSHIPTSGAVVDYVAAQLAPIGGLEVIADDESFPNTIPAAGVVISISDAAGLQVNSSGVSTNGDALDNSTITINGFPSELRGGVGGNADPYVLAAGTGLMVQSTGSSQTYNYHQVMIREADFVQLSDDINDFNSRYRINAGEPGSNNDDGDLVWDTTANKMKVYNSTASAWEEVTSVGDYKLLTIKDHDQASGGSGPTFNGSNEEFDLFDGSSDASITNAGQLLVVLNGVLQKPNTGTFSGSAEGFYLNDTHGIKFCDPPASGSVLFVTQIGSATSLQVPADGSVSAAKIGAGAVIAAKIGTGAVELAKMASESVDEDNLYISNAGSNGDFLSKQSGNNGGLTWATPADATKLPLAGGTITGDVVFDNATNAGNDLTWDMSDNALEFDDNVKATFGDAGDLAIVHTGSNSDITDSGTGDLRLISSTLRILNAAASETCAVFTQNGSVDLYYDNVKEFETKSGGVKLNGHSESIVTALTSNASITIDFSLSNHFSCTMGHNITFGNPSTESVGQSGTITLTQDGTGSRTAAWGTQFLWPADTAPTLSTTAAAVDRIDYVVVAADKIHCVASLGMA